MTHYQFIVSAVLISMAGIASAQSTNLQFTEPRNAAAASLGTTNFTVGRMARECFEVLKQPESFIQELVRSWQQKNEKYYAATTAYMTTLLKETEKKNGVDAMRAVTNEYKNAVQGEGAGTVSDLLKKGEKAKVCERYVGLVRGGEFDVKPGHPFYKELEELVNFFERK